ncbi:MAG TPA: hypothetical protein VNA87_01110 [Actinomycetota bacterium]|nr:hypothetical protein [Actinomycetota bacterium]
MEHVVVRKLEHLTGSASAPRISFAVEVRDRPGPAHKNGAFQDDVVWVQLQGGLFVARAKVRIAWIGEYSNIKEIRARTKGSPLYSTEDFWARRPKYGYAAVAQLHQEVWIDPFWAGPRSYGYEWILLEDQKKRTSWLDHKDPPRGGEELVANFNKWKAAH